MSWRTAPWHPSAHGKNRGALLRKNRQRIDDETFECWTFCESVRTERGPRQRVAATLGKLDDNDLRAGWDQIEALPDHRQPGPHQPDLPNGIPEDPPQRAAWELADLSRVEVAWADVADVLTMGKPSDQASELGIAESWYARTALEQITGLPAEAVDDDRL